MTQSSPKRLASRSHLWLIPALLVVQLLHAEKIGWHPDLVLGLGRGVSLRNPDAIKPAVAVMESDPNEEPVTGDLQINVRYAQHQFDLTRSFALNASLSAKNRMYEGSVKFGMVDSFKSSGNTLTFVWEGNRNFGDRLYSAIRLAPEFLASVDQLKRTLSGSALHQALAERFGTHFVSGQQKTAKVVLIYTLTYESQNVARSRALDLGLKYSDGISSINFQGDIKDELARSDTRVSLSYQFYSTDPFHPPEFALTAKISSFDEFLAHAAKVEAYLKSMDQANAKDVAYIVEPLQNLPGYLALLGGFSPATQFNTSYDRFMATYAQFKGWDDLLFEWSGDARRMSWLNDQGQTIVLGMRADVSLALRQLEEAAKTHFRDGTPLEVSENILNYRANFNRVPLPSINNIRYWPSLANSGHDILLGFVNCGPKELVKQSPFTRIHVLDASGKDQRAYDLYPDPQSFEAFIRGYFGATGLAAVTALFSDPIWTQLKLASEKNRILFYMYYEADDGPRIHTRGWSLALRDSSGTVASSIPLGFMSTDLGTASMEGSHKIDLSLSISEQSQNAAIVGRSMMRILKIANTGPGAAYGVSVSAPIPAGFEVGVIGGSQGAGSATNGVLTYHVGSLAYGSSAEIRFGLIPLESGHLDFSTPATVRAGEVLLETNSSDNQVRFAAMEVIPVSLDIAQKVGLVEVRWHSESDRLGVVESSQLGEGSTWTDVVASPTKDGKKRSLKLPTSAQRRFFRLTRRP